MKIRILAAVLLFSLIFGFALTAAPKAEAVVAAGNKAVFVEKNEEAGLSGRLYPVTSAGGSQTLYLPGSADAEKLTLSWQEGVAVTQNGAALLSGQTPIPQPGQEAVYEVNGEKLTLRTVLGSEGVRAMFLEVDPTVRGYFTFQAISNDPTKSRKALGTMTLGGEDGYFFTMKGRGNSTWTACEKKGYNITLYKDDTYEKKQSAELIEGVSTKAWSLLANDTDNSLLRNKLGYDMAEALGIGLKSDFVDLYVDGIYQGCYLMTPKNDYAAPEEGVVLEIDNYLDDEDPQFTLEGLKEYHPTREGFQNRFTVKENDAEVTTEEIQAYMQKAWDALRDTESDEYLQYIDLDSWAKYYLLHEFYKSFDVVCGSILMHRDGWTENDKLIAGPVWDLDNALGRTNNNVDLGMTPAQQHSPEGWYIQNVQDPEPWPEGDVVTAFWLQELGKHESFLARVREIYRENQDLFDGAAARVGEEGSRMRATAKMNEDLYGYREKGGHIAEADDHGCVATACWEDCMRNLANYAEKRADFLRNNIDGARPLPETPQPEQPAEFPYPIIIAVAAVAAAAAVAAVLLRRRKKGSPQEISHTS